MLSSLPNILTLFRIGLIPILFLFTLLHTPHCALIACGIFIVAALTDYWDGLIARFYGCHSDLGCMLDPIADKMLVSAILLALSASNQLSAMGVSFALIILMREIFVSGLREHLSGVGLKLPVTKLAKWKTAIQMIALGVLLVGDIAAPLLYLSFLPLTFIGELMLGGASFLTILTGVHYVQASIKSILYRS